MGAGDGGRPAGEVQALDRLPPGGDGRSEQVAIAGDLSVRWDLLADAAKGPLVWKAIARQMGPQALRMNLNTLLRHEVFGRQRDDAMVDYVAARIADAEEIRRSRQFPYQYLAAYLNADAGGSAEDQGGAGQAAEIACGNVPELPGPVVIGLDMSGSMSCAGHGSPRPRRDDEDALRRRGGPVRGGHAAPQPGQRRRAVRHAGVPGAGSTRRTRS